MRYLTAGLSCILVFIGAKMILEPWFHINVQVSLSTVAAILLISLLASLRSPAPTNPT
jgi:tellurite resistance protein TerC